MNAVSLDERIFAQPSEVIGVVARNLARLDNPQRERVLLAVAVLYGIVKPIEPPPPKTRRPPAPTTLRGRILATFRAMAPGDTTTATELAPLVKGRRNTVHSTLAKMTADGEVRRTAHGLYALASPQAIQGDEQRKAKT